MNIDIDQQLTDAATRRDQATNERESTQSATYADYSTSITQSLARLRAVEGWS